MELAVCTEPKCNSDVAQPAPLAIYASETDVYVICWRLASNELWVV